MQYKLYQNNRYIEIKEGIILEGWHITTDGFEDILSLGIEMFPKFIYECKHQKSPVNEIVFSDEEPCYDFSRELYEAEQVAKEIRNELEREVYGQEDPLSKIREKRLKILQRIESIDKKAYLKPILRLGEYRPNSRTIVLYYKNIKNCNRSTPEALIKVVFMHELIHALVHPNIDCSNLDCAKLEEAICEYGALCLSKVYKQGHLFGIAYNHIKAKQKCALLYHYGYGCYLYDREKLDTEKEPSGKLVSTLYLLKTRILTLTMRRTPSEFFLDMFNDVFRWQNIYPRDKQGALFDKLVKFQWH